MSLSSFCIEQRERETKRLKSFLAFSLMGSALLHGALLALGATIPWDQVLEPEAEPIEFTLVEPTELEAKLEEEPKKDEKEEEIELEVAAGTSESSTLLSGVDNGSPDMPSVELPQQASSRRSPEPDQPITSLRTERTTTPQPSIQPKTEAVPQSVPLPAVALKPEPKRDIPTRQTPKPQPQQPQSQAPQPKPQPSPIPDAKVSPSSTQNEEPKPEQRQEVAQQPKPTQNLTPPQSPVTTAAAPSTQENKPTRSENSVGSIIERIRNIGRQQPSSGEGESKIAANSSSDTQGQSQAIGNFRSNPPVPRGINRGDRNASSEGSRNTEVGSGGTITARGTSTDRSSGTNTRTDRATLPKPGRATEIAAVPRNRKPAVPTDEGSGSGSGRVACRSCPKPKYPERARRRGVEGDTRLSYDVDKDGRPVNVRVARSSGNDELDRAAIEGAQRWRLDPSSRGRQNVSSTIAFEIEGSQRQRQNRDRRRQRDERRGNRDAVATNSRETETPQTSRRTLSATNGNIPVETRRRTQPRSRQALPRQSDSAAVPRRRRSESAAVPRRRRSESAAVPRRRQQAIAPTPRRRQQAAALTPRRRQQAAVTPRRRQQAIAPTPRRRQQAAALTPRRRQQAAAPAPRTRRRQTAVPAPRRRQQVAPKPRLRQAAPAARPRQSAPAPEAAGSGSQ
jgi:TonB family protein